MGNVVITSNGYYTGSYTSMLTGMGVRATIITPSSGAISYTQSPLIFGTGATNGVVVYLTLSTGSSIIGSGIVVNGFWSITPTVSLAVGTQQLCVNSGSSCTMVTVTPDISTTTDLAWT